jgi:hypothetical protein
MGGKGIVDNAFFDWDNLDCLRKHFRDEIIDLTSVKGARIVLFVSLVKPARPMVREAVSAGYYESPMERSFSKIQILTVAGLPSGAQAPQYPDLARGGLSFRKAKTEAKKGKQPGMFGG